MGLRGLRINVLRYPPTESFGLFLGDMARSNNLHHINARIYSVFSITGSTTYDRHLVHNGMHRRISPGITF